MLTALVAVRAAVLPSALAWLSPPPSPTPTPSSLAYFVPFTDCLRLPLRTRSRLRDLQRENHLVLPTFSWVSSTVRNSSSHSSSLPMLVATATPPRRRERNDRLVRTLAVLPLVHRAHEQHRHCVQAAAAQGMAADPDPEDCPPDALHHRHRLLCPHRRPARLGQWPRHRFYHRLHKLRLAPRRLVRVRRVLYKRPELQLPPARLQLVRACLRAAVCLRQRHVREPAQSAVPRALPGALRPRAERPALLQALQLLPKPPPIRSEHRLGPAPRPPPHRGRP
jgi:hypothetical protein